MSATDGDRCPECRAMEVVSKRGGHWRCLACGWWVETVDGMLVGSYMGDFERARTRDRQWMDAMERRMADSIARINRG